MSKSPAVTPRWALARALGFTTLGVLLSPHRAATQMPDDGPRTTFLFARYATRTSRALYTGYGNESWQRILALIENPRTGYHEALMGVAKRITLAQRQSTIIALALSDASDSRYGEIYVVPSLAISARKEPCSTTSILFPCTSLSTAVCESERRTFSPARWER